MLLYIFFSITGCPVTFFWFQNFYRSYIFTIEFFTFNPSCCILYPGAGYEDATSSLEQEDDSVKPGGYYKYVWDIHPNSGPTIADPECLTYSYSSQVDTVRDFNSGLIGAFLICKSGLTESNFRNFISFRCSS